MLKKVMRIYSDVLSYIGVIGLIGFLAAVLIQVVGRTPLMTNAPNWTEEAARYLFIFMVAFAGNTAVATDEYVGVDLLVTNFPPKIQKVCQVLCLAAMFALNVVIFGWCVMSKKGLMAMTPPTMITTALRIPMKYIYYSMIILFGLYCISYPMRIYCVIKNITLYEKKGEEE